VKLLRSDPDSFPLGVLCKVCDRADVFTFIKLDRIDLFELNEAFAAQALACQRELGIDNAKLNVNGGAIAIGHPLGCSGARLATTLIHQMARTGASRGIASLCVGVGQGLATVFERE
jgi:acetyl-CoA acetyltransferase